MSKQTVNEVRQKYLDFFAEREHKVIASAPLVPDNDPTTLFTGSGMQPLVPYLLGQPHPQGNRLADSQKSFRAEDMDEVGDNRHTTFFEMLGNWSLGDYFKEEQIPWVFEFLTSEIGLDPQKLFVTVFAGDQEKGIPRDEDAVAIWKKEFAEKGIEAEAVELLTEENAAKVGMQDGRIFYYDAKKNWWSRSGAPENMPAGEPGGPDSEIFYDFETEHNPEFGDNCHPNCDCGRFMEIGNSVFMQYQKQEDGSFTPLPQKNVDFGGGLERITAAANNDPDVFNIDALQNVITRIEETYGLKYNECDAEIKKAMRIVADHLRAGVFLIGDGVLPSKSEQGYILRRLLRRAIFYGFKFTGGMNDKPSSLYPLVNKITANYKDAYPKLSEQEKEIANAVEAEEVKFRKTLENGIKKVEDYIKDNEEISAQQVFELHTTYGFPVELTQEIASQRGVKVSSSGLDDLLKQHKDKSRTAAAGKFAGGLADHSEMSIKYHTATHLLHQALRDVLGEHVVQKGSNITPKRLRFDFSHPDKLTDEEKQKVEEIINEKIQAGLEVKRSEMTVAEAKEKGALGLFEDKYADKVSVYQVGDYSIEICGGPHVANTKELGKFEIKKEQSASQGVRRIKAVLV